MATPNSLQQQQDYFRSISSESTTYMMVPATAAAVNTRRDAAPSKMWIAMVVIVVIVLQIASTTGLFVYLNMSVSQVRNCFLFSGLEKEEGERRVLGWPQQQCSFGV